jgi:hypothetical protein
LFSHISLYFDKEIDTDYMRFKMFCAVVLPFLIIFNSNVFTQSFNLSNLKLKEIINSYSSFRDTTAPKQIKEEKNAFIAGTLSLIGPGLAFGQIYNGQMDKFSSHICITVACLTGVLISAVVALHEGDVSEGSSSHVILLSSAILFMGNWVWSIIDAANSADEINRQNAMKKQHSDILNKLRFGLTLNKSKHLNLKFALEL